MSGAEIALIASVGSSVIKTVQGINQINAETKAVKQESLYNEAAARRETAQAIAAEHREQTLRAGRQFTQGAAQGAGTSGNLLDIMSDTAYQSELSILGMRDSLMMARQNEQSRRANASSSARTGRAFTLLSGASSMLGSYGSYKNDLKLNPPQTFVPKPGRKPVIG